MLNRYRRVIRSPSQSAAFSSTSPWSGKQCRSNQHYSSEMVDRLPRTETVPVPAVRGSIMLQRGQVPFAVFRHPIGGLFPTAFKYLIGMPRKQILLHKHLDFLSLFQKTCFT